ncbi:2-dehydropantoate 2-reductase [Aquincola sp. S2]|uniref:2-dehydropantoate 2-reductase n=1 Tax=Pseudaquabacterium terrae TaxID=2732868 RepID=A0ABX2EP01_9BURK|nr:2-dehydropantoate 2-reductase [Aquabacterium terrae]NRF70425.1 2-dehydropantoate 2-reductase [Aquabacterium terrae]
MRVCIVGAGAIGGFIGAKLAATGAHRVSALARGATLTALRRHGWRLREGGELQQAQVLAADEARQLGEQDLVIVAVKAPAMAAVAASIGPLLGSTTIVMPAMNGVPWWFGPATPALGSQPLETVDAGGEIAKAIPIERVIGCVVHASALVAEPGLVVHKMGRGLLIGEPQGGMSERVETLRAALEMAGFETTASADIRRGAWYKLWGNLVMNPVSAMTGATADRILDDPLVRSFCNAAMAEAAAVGARIGCAIEQSPDDRNAVTRKLGAFKTSMLQDAEAKRPIELDAIVGAVAEIGQRVGIPTPNIDALLGLTRLFGRAHGLYPDPPT